MKIFISVDMEGLAGLVSWTQEQDDREMLRNAMHQQLEWIVEGICASQRNEEVEEITVADSHGFGSNLMYDRISDMDKRMSLVSGSPRRQFMMAGLDSSYDVVFLVGYHAGAGHLLGCMDHTYSGRTVNTLYINDVVMNEATANAAYAGELRVPVGLVIGDSGLQEELLTEKRMPWVEFVKTKDSYSRKAARFVRRSELQRDTVAKTVKVLESDLSNLPLYQVECPCVLSITFTTSIMADTVAQIPGTARKDGRTVSVRCNSAAEMLAGISAFTGLAGTAI
ncbi:MAG TPA: M55 family metallopeptidase [Synergistaceae bacterium]|nr:M55 family metallopeptidase [Synergistaceae bacterium]HPQ36142.1 M55 family metallopeptidase [Synergistaceae bacterium]